MDEKRFDLSLRDIARVFLTVTVLVIVTAVLLGSAGALSVSSILLRLHPYVFFTGFGNLAILILNRYLTSAIYPELKIDPARQMRYIYAVMLSLVLVTLAVCTGWSILKAAAGLLLMVTVLSPLREIFGTLSVGSIWREVSVRYYIFDVVFLFVANLGLFTLGLKEVFPGFGLIPFFVTQSSYFLGSSFPLSISVMGFLYTYAWRRSPKRELVRKLFSLWFYVFVGGVLVFLTVILAGSYLGMMLMSHLLLFGVIALLVSFAFYLNRFFCQQFAHPAIAFLLAGLALLLATSAYGIFNIYFMKGVAFGSFPPIRADKMWIYHSHTHAALLGWIILSFTGMIYIVIPAIMKRGSLEALGSGEAMDRLLEERTMNGAFVQLTVMLVAASVILFSLFLKNLFFMGLGGLVYAAAVLYLRMNLGRDTGHSRKTGS
jgi:hypothetical protein